MISAMGYELEKEEIVKLLVQGDDDGSGTLEFSEFLGWMKMKRAA